MIWTHRTSWERVSTKASWALLLGAAAWFCWPALAAADGGSWEIETLDDGAAFAFSAIAFDAQQRPHLSYHDTSDNSLRYAYHDGTQWQFEVAATTECPSWGCYDGGTAIAVDSQGRPHIAFYDDLNHRLNYAYRGEAGWVIEPVSADGSNGRNPSLRIDSNDVPHVSFSGPSWNLMYAHRTGGSWTLQTVDVDGRENSLVLDAADRPQISYFSAGANHFLKHASFDGTSWQSAPVDDEADHYPGPSNSIALDSLGNSLIAYSVEGQGENSHKLRLAHWDGTAWQIETVIESDRVLRQVRLALGADDRAQIAYAPYDSENTLYHLRETATGWQQTTVDERAVTHLAIALGPQDIPSISYVAGDERTLTYAAYAPFAEGSGTAVDPWRIGTAADMDRIRDHLGGHFVLSADIDLAVSPYNEGAGFVPIGTYINPNADENRPFSGSFDGAGFRIQGLMIDAPDTDAVGLFAWADGAELRNLTLEGVEIDGDSGVGSLVGRARDTRLEDLHVSGRVTGQNGEVGGLVGWTRRVELLRVSTAVTLRGTVQHGNDAGGIVGNAQNGTLFQHCRATGSVTGNQARIGGITGALWESVIEDSFASGDVAGRGNTGGLVGTMGHANSRIERSYATGNVAAAGEPNHYFGGLVGDVSNGLVRDVFALGDVQGPSQVGGLIGLVNTQAELARAYSVGQVQGDENVGGLLGTLRGTLTGGGYYASDTSGQSDTDKGEPRTSAEMRAGLDYQPGQTFDGWFEADSAWAIAEGAHGGFPYLADLATVAVDAQLTGSGSVRWLGDYPIGTRAPLLLQPDEGYWVDAASGCGGALDGDQFTTGPLLDACTVTVVFATEDDGGDDGDDGGDGDEGDDQEPGGCACQVSAGSPPSGSALLILLLAGLLGRRRRQTR